MSGLQIFNAHPALYCGKVSAFDIPLMAMTSTEDDPPKGVTTVLGRPFETTGFLGFSAGSDGEPADRGFSSWLTLPSDQDLTGGRSWHFFFAWAFVLNGAAYVLYVAIRANVRFCGFASQKQTGKCPPFSAFKGGVSTASAESRHASDLHYRCWIKSRRPAVFHAGSRITFRFASSVWKGSGGCETRWRSQHSLCERSEAIRGRGLHVAGGASGWLRLRLARTA